MSHKNCAPPRTTNDTENPNVGSIWLDRYVIETLGPKLINVKFKIHLLKSFI